MCDDGWSQAEAGVLCRQLGYTSGTVLGSSMFGQNRQLDILLDDVACTGTEASLAGCTYSAGGSDCGHFEDLGVECSSALNSAACPPACLLACLHFAGCQVPTCPKCRRLLPCRHKLGISFPSAPCLPHPAAAGGRPWGV